MPAALPRVPFRDILQIQKRERLPMNQAFAEEFIARFTKTAIEGDHAAHMAMISTKVMLRGVPGFDVIGYDDWSQQCAHEFEERLIRSIAYEDLDVKMANDTLVCFEIHETIEARDGTVNRNWLEIFLEREADDEWRIVQERILPE